MVDGSDDTFPTILCCVMMEYLKRHTLHRQMVSRYEDILEGEDNYRNDQYGGMMPRSYYYEA